MVEKRNLKTKSEDEKVQALKEGQTVVIEPVGLTDKPVDAAKKDNASFVSKTYLKNTGQLKRAPLKRPETKVIGTGIYFKTSVLGNSIVGDIAGQRYTVRHEDIMNYVEGITNSVRFYQVVLANPPQDETKEEPITN